jgi:DNA-binding response OmpR family regulator
MRLLIVEDDDLLGAAVQKGLARSGYATDWIRSGEHANVAMANHEYDGVLLDLGLPDMPGEALLRAIRQRNPGLPVLVMTARGAIQDRISLLDIGADDYMVKPIDLSELAARLRAIVRRTQSTVDHHKELVHGALQLRPSCHQACWNGKPVLLTKKEYGLIETFVRRKNQVLTRAQLEDTLYGWGEEVGSNTVEVYIHFLRRKFCASLIQTVRGVGYQLGSGNALFN